MSEDLIVIRVFNNEVDAGMAQQLLRDAGLKSFTFKDDAGGMEPQLQLSGGVRLVISRADAEQAEMLLASFISE